MGWCAGSEFRGAGAPCRNRQRRVRAVAPRPVQPARPERSDLVRSSTLRDQRDDMQGRLGRIDHLFGAVGATSAFRMAPGLRASDDDPAPESCITHQILRPSGWRRQCAAAQAAAEAKCLGRAAMGGVLSARGVGQRCHCGCETTFGRSCVTTCECG